MPIVEVKLFSGRDDLLKKKVAKKIANVFVDEMNMSSNDIAVIFNEIEYSDWYDSKKLSKS